MPGSFVAPPPLPYYLRFIVKDRPGILAAIAAALARQDVNLDALLRNPAIRRTGCPLSSRSSPAKRPRCSRRWARSERGGLARRTAARAAHAPGADS